MKKSKKFELEDISKEKIYECLQRNISEKIDYWYRIKKAIEYIEENKPIVNASAVEDILRGNNE